MFDLLFSAAARKAWASGVITAILTPLVAVFSADSEVTPRTIFLALASGVISALTVYGTTNTPPGEVTVDDLPGEHAADR